MPRLVWNCICTFFMFFLPIRLLKKEGLNSTYLDETFYPLFWMIYEFLVDKTYFKVRLHCILTTCVTKTLLYYWKKTRFAFFKSSLLTFWVNKKSKHWKSRKIITNVSSQRALIKDQKSKFLFVLRKITHFF